MLVTVTYGNSETQVFETVDNANQLFIKDSLIKISDDYMVSLVDEVKLVEYCRSTITPFLDHVLTEAVACDTVELNVVTKNYRTVIKLHKTCPVTVATLPINTARAYHAKFNTELNSKAAIFIIPMGQLENIAFSISHKIKKNVFTCTLPHTDHYFNKLNLGDIYATINEGLVKSYLPVYVKTTVLPIIEKILIEHTAYSGTLTINYNNYRVNIKLYKRTKGGASITGRTCSKYKMHLKHQVNSPCGYVGGLVVKEFLT